MLPLEMANMSKPFVFENAPQDGLCQGKGWQKHSLSRSGKKGHDYSPESTAGIRRNKQPAMT